MQFDKFWKINPRVYFYSTNTSKKIMDFSTTAEGPCFPLQPLILAPPSHPLAASGGPPAPGAQRAFATTLV